MGDAAVVDGDGEHGGGGEHVRRRRGDDVDPFPPQRRQHPAERAGRRDDDVGVPAGGELEQAGRHPVDAVGLVDDLDADDVAGAPGGDDGRAQRRPAARRRRATMPSGPRSTRGARAQASTSTQRVDRPSPDIDRYSVANTDTSNVSACRARKSLVMPFGWSSVGQACAHVARS